MQPVEIFSPPPDAAHSPESACLGRAQNQQPAEPFDAVMGFALARSPRKASDDSESPDEPRRGKDKANQIHKSDPTNPARPDPPVCAESLVARAAPPAAPAAEISKPLPETGPRVEVVSGTSPTTVSPSAAQTDSSSAAAIGSSSLAGDLAGARASAGAEPQPPQEAAPNNILAGNDVSGPKTGPQKEPAGEGEPAADSGLFPALMPALSGRADPESELSNTTPSPPTPSLPGKADPESGGSGSADRPAEISTSLVSQLPGPEVSEITGISSAQHQMPMQKAEKTNEFSASAEQNLPVAPAGNTGEELPAKLARAASTSPRHDKSELTPATDSSAPGPASSAQTASAPGEASPWPSAAPARSLERAHDLMSLHAFRLRDSGADSLQMVIKPGPGLQLSLNLQMRNGTVEMHARLNRGDFDFFSKHWSELQQQLEARGVRLAPLTCGEQSVGGGKHPFQRPGRQTEADTAPTEAFAEFALAGAMKPATTTKTNPPRGWESWA